jgi:hypothetical protein
VKSKPANNDFESRVKEYENGLVDIDKKTKVTDKKSDAPPVSSDNPYLKARIAVLDKMTDFKRNEIKEMEKIGDTDNRFYADFVHEVSCLGDIFSPL